MNLRASLTVALAPGVAGYGYNVTMAPMAGGEGTTTSKQIGQLDCTSGYRNYNPLIHKPVYTVGVQGSGGIEIANREFNLTFVEYLTKTAGKRFDPPITFEMVSSTSPIHDWVDSPEENPVDFIYTDTGVYSCIGVEIGAEPLATTVSTMTVRGHQFDLDMFAGVIFTRADNEDINSVADLKNSTIGALSISDFAGGQVQFYVMEKSGLNFIMDPKQVVFTHNQYEIVTGVLNNVFEVGFVRTGMIERTKDEENEPIDPDLFKILEPRIYVLDDGTLFPFLHSSPVFPEWPFAALPHVPRDVAEEAQAALLKLDQYKVVGEKMNTCKEELCAVGDCSDEELEICDTAPPEFFDPDCPCDTTREFAHLARMAANAAGNDGFRSPRSYFDLRSMQADAGFIMKNAKGKDQCIRAETLYDGIHCPLGHYKLSREDFEDACDEAGMPCPEGYDCYCRPCVEAFEVEVFEHSEGVGEIHNLGDDDRGCEKMSLCGSVEQTRTITFRMSDNLQRANPKVEAIIHMNEQSKSLEITKVANRTFVYQTMFSQESTGVGILEIFFDGEQIPESPFRVQVAERNCDLDFPGKGMSPTDSGVCQCGSGTIDLGGECMPSSSFAIIISTILVTLALVGGYCFLRYKRRKSDEVWLISVEELHFGEPVEIIGQGSFGVVLLAEYRGTMCAIKRALPPSRNKKGSTKASNSGSKDLLVSTGSAGQGSISGSFGGNSIDLEGQASKASKEDVQIRSLTGSKNIGTTNSAATKSGDLSFLARDYLSFETVKWWHSLCPMIFGLANEQARIKSSILRESSEGSYTRLSLRSLFCPWFDKKSRQREEFLEEMRLLSRLRHPCITTVMGAVISSGHDPMLVMEHMEYGSLYDLLHSEAMFFTGEICLQIARDLAQGLRYLHSSKPPILHGDLKAKNVLIDSRFRAKVCDFGLSTKKKNGISGTLFWLAPEYLRGKTNYNATCDMYSVGIIFYELYSRKDPYEGENYRTVLRKVCDPRKNHRPGIPETCPPKMATLMKNLWSQDPFFRPQAKDLDMALLDMSARDAEPLEPEGHSSKATSKEMLYQLFPKHVADALKAGQKVEPEQHDLVTVVFAEIVEFEEMTRRLAPLKIENLLERTFCAIDKVARQFEVFKVETVGQCYMGVTNLEGKQEVNHVTCAAQFSLAALDAVRDILVDAENPHHGHVHLRVGFHSGPVVTNVIGNLNPRYGLFGDTVNTASRMETHSLPNRVQCSEKSALLLREQDPEMLIIKRGKVGVKGKGEMVLYWIGDKNRLRNHEDKSHSGHQHVSFGEDHSVTSGYSGYSGRRQAAGAADKKKDRGENGKLAMESDHEIKIVTAEIATVAPSSA